MIMKKQYILPKAEVFVCKINSMLMASANLDSLIDETNGEIIPVSEENIGEFSGRDTDYDW